MKTLFAHAQIDPNPYDFLSSVEYKLLRKMFPTVSNKP